MGGRALDAEPLGELGGRRGCVEKCGEDIATRGVGDHVEDVGHCNRVANPCGGYDFNLFAPFSPAEYEKGDHAHEAGVA